MPSVILRVVYPSPLSYSRMLLSPPVRKWKSCRTRWDPTDYTDHGILQARILEWVAVPFSRASSQPRDWTQVSRIAGGFCTIWATWGGLIHLQACPVFSSLNQRWPWIPFLYMFVSSAHFPLIGLEFTWSLLSGLFGLGAGKAKLPCSRHQSSIRFYGWITFYWVVHVCVLSHVRLSVTPWTVARRAPLSVGFSWQEYWSALPCPPPGIEPASPTSPVLAGGFFTTGATWEAHVKWTDLLLSFHPPIDGHLACFHLLPLTNNNNGMRSRMFHSGLSFFLGYVSRSYTVGSCGHPASSHWETLRLSSQVAGRSYIPPAAGENSSFSTSRPMLVSGSFLF